MYIGARAETRFMYLNNLAYANNTYATTNVPSFIAANIVTANRTSLYIPQNLFKITSVNKTFQLTKGAGAKTTYNLTEGSYTAIDLTAHINSVASIDCTYTPEKFFAMRNGATSLTLHSNENINFWNMLGYSILAPITTPINTYAVADKMRLHTEIELFYDLGASADCSFFSLLGERNKTFCLSSSAIINLRLSNINNYDTAPINILVTPTVNGAMTFIDALEPVPFFRYVWLTIVDYENPTVTNFSFSHLFLGGFTAFYGRTINNGFTLSYQDRSIRTESVSGALFFEKYNKYPYLDNLVISFLTKQQANILQQLWYDLGKSQHFYLSLDSGHLTGDLSELTFFGVFDSDPVINHVAPRFFDTTFAFRGD